MPGWVMCVWLDGSWVFGSVLGGWVGCRVEGDTRVGHGARLFLSAQCGTSALSSLTVASWNNAGGRFHFVAFPTGWLALVTTSVLQQYGVSRALLGCCRLLARCREEPGRDVSVGHGIDGIAGHRVSTRPGCRRTAVSRAGRSSDGGWRPNSFHITCEETFLRRQQRRPPNGISLERRTERRPTPRAAVLSWTFFASWRLKAPGKYGPHGELFFFFLPHKEGTGGGIQ